MLRLSNIVRLHANAHRVLAVTGSGHLRQYSAYQKLIQNNTASSFHHHHKSPTAPFLQKSLARFLCANPSDKHVDPKPTSAESKSPPESPSSANPSPENESAKPDTNAAGEAGKKPDSEHQKGDQKQSQQRKSSSSLDPNGNGDSSNSSWLAQAALAAFVMLGLSILGSRENGREISFHAFVWDLLKPGLVDRVEVVNRNMARVYLKPSARSSLSLMSSDSTAESSNRYPNFNDEDSQERGDAQTWGSGSDRNFTSSSDGNGQMRPSLPPLQDGGASESNSSADSPFYFNIGNLDMFERKLEAIQEDLGVEPDDFVPIVYTKETSVMTELLRQLPSIVLLGVGILVLRNALGQFGGMGGGRSGIFQVGKANPTIVKGDSNAPSTTFAEVAGLDEAKQEVMEFVDFLKHPIRYEKLGAKIPKGALLVGPPGTGKTLLAKATAGEANVPFFSMSGSDFIEMFVGVGPSRVRDLFAQARSSAPCIIFIDEIDAIGKARGRGGVAGGNDERENTLNALLVEMDGFSSTTGVVVLAGTNRADVLDRALLRPGRFDRQISIDKPDMRGRFEILLVHLKPLKLQAEASTVAKRLAALTPGFAGADLANICNEAALIAARGEKNAVEIIDFERATDRVIGGLEKKNKVISRKEREIVAHHEAGHAVAGWFLKHADPLIKVSIIPRGSAALGFAQYLPSDKVLQSKEQMRDFMIMALGGRVAEHLCFGSITTGAQDDLRRITRAVYAQVTNFGMSEKVGKVYFPRAGESGNHFYKPYSEQTAELIDDEAIRIVDDAYDKCEVLLKSKLDILKTLAQRLLEKEVIGEEDLIDVMGERPFAKPVTYDEFVGRFEADRRMRTGRGGPDDDKDKEAKDGSMTPPIPVAGAAGGSNNSRSAGTGEDASLGGSEEGVIPELA